MCSDRSRLIVAVDGGGSSCRACVSDLQGNILGRATGQPANITTDLAASRKNILNAVGKAYADAGLSPDRMPNDYGYLGLAGASLGDVADRLKASLDFYRVVVTSDREITVQGALGTDDGTVALFGTGSFYVTRSAGVTRGVGGWGFRLCDDGGGAYLGLALLREVIRAHDGLIEHSPLSRAVLHRYGGAAQGLVTFAQAANPLEFGAFAPQLVEAFNVGDAIAVQLINQVVARMHNTLDNLAAINSGPLILLGGLGPFYQGQLSAQYQAICGKAVGDALAGAIILARAELVEAEG